jgi:copper chaperone
MKTTLFVQNVKCQGCANTIISKISNLPHVRDVSVNKEEHSVTFSYTANEVLLEVKKTLHILGYPEVSGDSNLADSAKF